MAKEKIINIDTVQRSSSGWSNMTAIVTTLVFVAGIMTYSFFSSSGEQEKTVLNTAQAPLVASAATVVASQPKQPSFDPNASFTHGEAKTLEEKLVAAIDASNEEVHERIDGLAETFSTSLLGLTGEVALLKADLATMRKDLDLVIKDVAELKAIAASCSQTCVPKTSVMQDAVKNNKVTNVCEARSIELKQSGKLSYSHKNGISWLVSNGRGGCKNSSWAVAEMKQKKKKAQRAYNRKAKAYRNHRNKKPVVNVGYRAKAASAISYGKGSKSRVDSHAGQCFVVILKKGKRTKKWWPVGSYDQSSGYRKRWKGAQCGFYGKKEAQDTGGGEGGNGGTSGGGAPSGSDGGTSGGGAPSGSDGGTSGGGAPSGSDGGND